MSAKILAIMAAVIGFIPATYAVFVINFDVGMHKVVPNTVDIWRDWTWICATVITLVFWSLSVLGFISYRKHHRNHEA